MGKNFGGKENGLYLCGERVGRFCTKISPFSDCIQLSLL